MPSPQSQAGHPASEPGEEAGNLGVCAHSLTSYTHSQPWIYSTHLKSDRGFKQTWGHLEMKMGETERAHSLPLGSEETSMTYLEDIHLGSNKFRFFHHR